jgi:hypothetical protein
MMSLNQAMPQGRFFTPASMMHPDACMKYGR